MGDDGDNFGGDSRLRYCDRHRGSVRCATCSDEHLSSHEPTGRRSFFGSSVLGNPGIMGSPVWDRLGASEPAEAVRLLPAPLRRLKSTPAPRIRLLQSRACVPQHRWRQVCRRRPPLARRRPWRSRTLRCSHFFGGRKCSARIARFVLVKSVAEESQVGQK